MLPVAGVGAARVCGTGGLDIPAGAIGQVPEMRRDTGIVSGRGEGRPAETSAMETSPLTAVLSDGAEGSWTSFSVFCSLIWAIPSIKSIMTDNAILSHIVM
jgi:hypothetical protein